MVCCTQKEKGGVKMEALQGIIDTIMGFIGDDLDAIIATITDLISGIIG